MLNGSMMASPAQAAARTSCIAQASLSQPGMIRTSVLAAPTPPTAPQNQLYNLRQGRPNARLIRQRRHLARADHQRVPNTL